MSTPLSGRISKNHASAQSVERTTLNRVSSQKTGTGRGFDPQTSLKLDIHRVLYCPVMSLRSFFAFFLCGYTPKDTRNTLHYILPEVASQKCWNQQRKGDRPLALAGPSCPSRNVTEAAAGDPRQLPCLAAPSLMLLAHSDAAGGRSRRLGCSKA